MRRPVRPRPSPAQIALRAYRAAYGRGAYAHLARGAEMPASRISELAAGKVYAPSPENAARIARASGGALTAAMLLGLDTIETGTTIAVPASAAHASSDEAAE